MNECVLPTTVRLLVFVCSLIFSLSALAKTPEPDSAIPEQWLKRMAVQTNKINYTGIISYQYGDQLVSAKMHQRIVNNKPELHLVYVDGIQGEVVQQNNVVKFFVANKTRSADNSKDDQVDFNIKNMPDRMARLSDAYNLWLGESRRVAGRDVVVVKMQPKDPFRYAHTLYIDKNTALLLKSETIDDNNKLLERFQFVQIDIRHPSPLMRGERVSSVSKIKDSIVRKTTQLNMFNKPSKSLDWKVGWAPKGFSLVNTRHGKNQSSSCMFTDGLSSFSVYVELRSKDYKGGTMRHGASIVVSRPIILKQVEKAAIVVGDIPIATAERIIQSIVTNYE